MNCQIVNQYLTSKISRGQAIKVGGLAALGLAFSKPIISTSAPSPAFANYAGSQRGGGERGQQRPGN